MAKKKIIKQAKQKFPAIAEFNQEYGTEEQLLYGSRLVPTLGSIEEALVYAVGAEKHAAESWRDGMPWSVCLSKLMRHLGKFLARESRCPKDGQHHLGSVKFWCNALMEYEQTHPEMDDIRGS